MKILSPYDERHRAARHEARGRRQMPGAAMLRIKIGTARLLLRPVFISGRPAWRLHRHHVCGEQITPRFSENRAPHQNNGVIAKYHYRVRGGRRAQKNAQKWRPRAAWRLFNVNVIL